MKSKKQIIADEWDRRRNEYAQFTALRSEELTLFEFIQHVGLSKSSPFDEHFGLPEGVNSIYGQYIVHQTAGGDLELYSAATYASTLTQDSPKSEGGKFSSLRQVSLVGAKRALHIPKKFVNAEQMKNFRMKMSTQGFLAGGFGGNATQSKLEYLDPKFNEQNSTLLSPNEIQYFFSLLNCAGDAPKISGDAPATF